MYPTGKLFLTDLGDFHEKCKNQHLYIISDEEIKEGDWCWNQYKGESEMCIGQVGKSWDTSMKKIIATTDELLGLGKFETQIVERWGKSRNQFPQPSQSFIEKYVEEYNKGNVITEVMVEYGFIKGVGAEFGYKSSDIEVLKINPKDNTITIRKIKDSWNREEVIRLLLDFNNDKPGVFDCSGWIEENL